MMDLAGNGVIVLAASGTAPDSRYDPGAYLTLEQYGLPDLVVLRQGLVRDVPDISALPQIPSVVDALYRQGMHSYARIPMMMEGTLIGALNLGSDRVGHFTGEQLDFARSLANQIGIAVQQATLRERIAQQSAELEERVKERTTQLASANEDLEAFSFTVSHDLRAPLRAIDGFSRMLQEDYAGKLDENGQHLLRTIRANSQRMGALIDDLLGFAQLGRARLNTARVDMGVLVREAWAETIGDAHIGFHLAPLPDVQGDRALLRQVWLNLLSNACKYSSKREQPAVEVSATEAEDEIIYAVRDNGAGFDMRYYEKLFGVFQRLHSNQEFPGTGVGLAMVHRVVTRHGGRVWAESILDAGAQFYFSLPKLAPASPG
jgi:signal transduction histidine kinase